MTDANDAMLQWKQSILDNCGYEVYSDEWWQAMTDALVFVPEEMREVLMAGLVGMGAAL